MTAPIDDLLASAPDDLELCSAVADLIARHHGGDLDASTLPQEQQAVLLAFHAKGIIDNGGFNRLFESEFEGDPHFELTARAFAVIGCPEAADSFSKVFALFPEGKPPRERGPRLRQYRSGPSKLRRGLDNQFFDGSADLYTKQAAYIRAQRDAFAELVDRLPMPRKEKPLLDPDAPPGLPLEMVPHWARVAFAARCARHVLPYFEQHWPEAAAKRRKAVVRAIELAERSASEAEPADGLEEAELAAIQAAGVAFMAVGGAYQEPEEPMPGDGNAALIASFVAKTAQHAARAARSTPDESAQAASEAASFAFQAAGDDEELCERIRHDLARLQVAAARERWKNRTPVSPELLDALPDHDPPTTRGVPIIDVIYCLTLAVVTLAFLPTLPAGLSELAGLLAIYTTVVGILIGARQRMAPPLYFGVWLAYIGLGLAMMGSAGFSAGRLALVLGGLWALYFHYPEVRDALLSEPASAAEDERG